MTRKTDLLKAIRLHCLNCCGGSWLDVENCTSGPDARPYNTCVLWPYRLGTDPNPSQSKVESGRRLAHQTNGETLSNLTKGETLLKIS